MEDFGGFDDLSFLSSENQQFQASYALTPQMMNQIHELPGMMQISSLPSTSRDANLQIGQEYPQFAETQFPETVNTAMQPLILQLAAATQTMQPLISDLFVEAVKTVIPPLISELVGSFGEALKTTMRPLISELVVEEMNKMVHSSGLRSPPRQAEPSAPRSQQLHFVGSLPDTRHTFTKIQDDLLRVELRDGSGSRVEVGPEPPAKVRLVVLDGDFAVDHRADWTKEEFNRNVVKPRKDKGPLLKGRSEIYLIKGVADFTDIVFTDNSKPMRNGTFRLGAELVDGVAREAVSEPFVVKERRLLSIDGSRLSLKDTPRHLKYIGDANTQKLSTANIHTVQDFLQLYHADAKALQKILHINENKLSEIAKSAEPCQLTEEHYSYNNETEGVHLVLDCVFDIKGVTFTGQTSQAYESLDDSQKELVNKLRAHAFEMREQLPRTCVLTKQISVQVDPVGPSSTRRSGTEAFANDIQAVTRGTDELGTRCCRAKWISVRAIVLFKVALKVSVKQGPRAAKRQRHG